MVQKCHIWPKKPLHPTTKSIISLNLLKLVGILLEKVRVSEQIDTVGSWSMSVKAIIPPNPKFIGGTELLPVRKISTSFKPHLEIGSDDEGSTITYKETHLLNYLNSGSIGISTLSISKLALPSGDRIGINAALKFWAERLKVAMVSPVI